MATDIWGHIEYRPKGKKFFVHLKDINCDEWWSYPSRDYEMFQAMSGARWMIDDIKQLFETRGLPDDLSRETWRKYKDGEPDFHTASWLDTDELKQCIDHVRDIDINKLKYDPENVEKCLKFYMEIYNCMKSSDDDGDYTRLVFWFDN